jgi:RluA family pseudouridine synthase
MILIREHIVTKIEETIRFIDYSIEIFKDLIPSNKGIKKAIKRGELLLNEKITESGRYIKKGDKIQLFSIDSGIPKSYDLKLEIVYEDEFLAIINKPAGINVSGNMYRTIVNSLPYNLTKSNQSDALSWFRPIHRLDNQTSGLLIIAKTQKSMILLGKMLENKKIQKIYEAIVIGKTKKEGIINKVIDGKEAITEYNLIKTVKSLRNDNLSLLKLSPRTGRTHQLRIHLSEMSFPILGDKLYGKEGEILKHKGLFLSAVRLIFKHPITEKKLELKIGTPYKFISLLEREQKRFNNYNN